MSKAGHLTNFLHCLTVNMPKLLPLAISATQYFYFTMFHHQQVVPQNHLQLSLQTLLTPTCEAQLKLLDDMNDIRYRVSNQIIFVAIWATLFFPNGEDFIIIMGQAINNNIGFVDSYFCPAHSFFCFSNKNITISSNINMLNWLNSISSLLHRRTFRKEDTKKLCPNLTSASCHCTNHPNGHCRSGDCSP